MFLYDPIGKTLCAVHKDCGSNPSGYTIFILEDENDKTGKEIGTDFSIGIILSKFPKYAEYVVKYENNFFGITVLRAIRPGLIKNSVAAEERRDSQ